MNSQELQQLKQHNLQLKAELEKVTRQRNHLFGELSQYSGLKNQTFTLFRTAIHHLQLKSDLVGRPKRISDPQGISTSFRSLTQAKRELQVYDQIHLTDKRLVGSPVKRRIVKLILRLAMLLAKLNLRILRRLYRTAKRRQT